MEYWSFAANCYKAKEQETWLLETKSNSFIIPILQYSITPISHALDFEHEDEHEDEHDSRYIEHPVYPIQRRLRARRKQCSGIPVATPGRRGLAH
jgi:hypothetical protein